MKITLNYTSPTPADIMAGMQAAADLLDSEILNQENVLFNVDYTNIGGNTLADASPSIGEMTYPQLVAALTAAPGVSRSYPTTLQPDPTNGGTYLVSNAELKAWGLLSPTSTEVDGTVNVSSSFAWNSNQTGTAGTYDLVGVGYHELRHALGGVILNNVPTALNLATYGPTGKLDLTTTDPRYFSVDGGKTHIANFDSNSDPGDFSGTTDPLNEFISPGRVYLPSGADKAELGVLGFNVQAPTPPPSATGHVVIFSASATTMNFLHGEGDSIYVTGTNQTVTVGSGADENIYDQGQGLNIAPSNLFAGLDVYGFRDDKIGHITLALGDTVAALGPDGRGGTTLRINHMGGPAIGSSLTAGEVHFVNDPFVTRDQIT